jgi:hypothetical protein
LRSPLRAISLRNVVTDQLLVAGILLTLALITAAGISLLVGSVAWAASFLLPASCGRRFLVARPLVLKCIGASAVFVATMESLLGTGFERAGVWLGVVPGSFIFSVIPRTALEGVPEAALYFAGLASSILLWALVAFAAVRARRVVVAKPAVA